MRRGGDVVAGGDFMVPSSFLLYFLVSRGAAVPRLAGKTVSQCVP